MHCLCMLLLVLFHFASISPTFAAAVAQSSENESKLPSIGAASDRQVFEEALALHSPYLAPNTQAVEYGLTFTPSDQPLDKSNGNSSPVPASDSTNALDKDTVDGADAAGTELNTDSSPVIVAEKPCSSPGRRPKFKVRRKTDACDAGQQINTGAIGDQGQDRDDTKPPSVTIERFGTRPLGRNEKMDDVCKRFGGGLMPMAVCSSGDRTDEHYSPENDNVVFPIDFVLLENCFRGTFLDLKFLPAVEKILYVGYLVTFPFRANDFFQW